MTFARSESQTLIENTASLLLAKANASEARRQRLSAVTPDRLALWPQLAEQGVLGAAFTEQAGGFGGTMRDLAVVMTQVGRRLVVEPVLYGAVCGRVLHAAGDTERLATFISGECVLSLAHCEGADPFAPLATQAVSAAGKYRLSGRKLAVRHADCAQAFVVSADLSGQPAWFLVDANDAGVNAETYRLLDASGGATLSFRDASARLLQSGAAAIDEALVWLLVGLAAETTGIVEALNETTFAYLGTRKQFGVPLASFQALQHRAAEMYAAAEQLRSLCNRAIDAIDDESPTRIALASAVKAFAADMGRRVGHEGVQMHGGMGVSDELDVSHYMRRLATIRAEFGSAEVHRTRFTALAGGY